MSKLRIIIIIFVSIIILVGGTVLIFKNTNYYKSVQTSKQLVVAIENDDVEKAIDVVKQYPNCVNALPSIMPHWLQLISDYPDVYYPLQEACAWENYDIVKLLIDNGADVNCVYKGIESSAPPLVMIIKVKSKQQWMDKVPHLKEKTIDIINLLLEHGADKSIKDSNGKTAYDYAIENGNIEFAKLLKD